MLDVLDIRGSRRPAKAQGSDFFPYFAELLADAPQVVLDYLAEDLAEYERSGFASKTMVRLLERARCLADADRIEMNFAA